MTYKTVEANIKSVFRETAFLEIFSFIGHDMSVKTKVIDRETQEFDLGQDARIYSWQGSMNFGDLHEQFSKILYAESMLNAIKPVDPIEIDLATMEKAELVEYVADQYLLTMYRDTSGCVGIQTQHSDYEDLSKGPIVWLCGPRTKKRDSAMTLRRKLCAPLFDLTKKLGDTFNRPRPERF